MSRPAAGDRAALLRTYRRSYNPALAKLFSVAGVPIEDHGYGTRLFDEDGRGYLDFSAGYGVFGIGHLNPVVQQAAQHQLATAASLPAGVSSPVTTELTERLRGLLPADLDHVLLAGSGSEAMEIALRVVSAAAPGGRTRLVAATDSYHGKSLGALAVMGQRQLRSTFEPLWPEVSFVPFGDPAAIAKVLSTGSVAAVVLEPILGGGYLVVPPAGYLAAVARLCRDAGALLVVDEVQTGFGRTGRMFAIEAEEVVPDLLVVSKGMTGGQVPMAAVVVRDRVVSSMPAEAWLAATQPPAEISSSLVACAAADAAIGVTVELGLPARAASRGKQLLSGLRDACQRHPRWLRSVRGQGLMTGLELRSGIVEYAIWLQLLSHGVLAGYSTNAFARHPVLRFFPPLTVTESEIDQAMSALDDSLAALSRRPAVLYDLANLALPMQYRIPDVALRTVSRLLLSR